jgi:hypothetical protein
MRGFIYFLIFLAYFIAELGCKKNKIFTDTSGKLSFSKDTLLFDTVFTRIGSTTKYFLVKNDNNGILKISRIRLGRGQQSFYRFNVDGFPGPVLMDIEIPAKDSLFVFVELTIDPLNSNSPLIVRDSLIFEVNGQQQDVKLVAFGQDVHFFNSQIIGTQNWVNDKPYLIYNSIFVDTNEVLTIQRGCRIYSNPRTRILVAGSLQVLGSVDQPVIFQADRMEDRFKDAPGQWVGIYMLAGSKNNILRNVEIKNAVLGVQIDTVFTNTPNTLIENTFIKNMTYIGLLVQGSHVEADNLVIANCGQHALVLNIGGKYRFSHCTIANYYTKSGRSTSSVVLNNYYEDVNGNIQLRPITQADFLNCIVYGDAENEIAIDKTDNADLNYRFDNCLLKSGRSINGSSQILNQDPRFVDVSDLVNDFRVVSGSPAIGVGNAAFAVGASSFDMKGKARIIPIDLGAYIKAN